MSSWPLGLFFLHLLSIEPLSYTVRSSLKGSLSPFYIVVYWSVAMAKHTLVKELVMVMRSKYAVPRARLVYTGRKTVAELKAAQVVSAKADNDNNEKEEK